MAKPARRRRSGKLLAPEDRVAAVTPDLVQHRIDSRLRESVEVYANRSKHDLTRRIFELEQEWDIERWIELNASVIAFMGLSLGVVKSKKWFLLPLAVTGFLFQHATEGWCPPIPVMRRLGIRTRQEICRELYALKALRGDFEGIADLENPERRAQKAIDASLAYS